MRSARISHLDVIETLVPLQHLRWRTSHVEVAQAIPTHSGLSISQAVCKMHYADCHDPFLAAHTAIKPLS